MPKPLRSHFTSSQGLRLAAICDLPDKDPLGYALFAHCFTCTKDLKAAHWIGRNLAEQGIAMLRFDFAGLGQSGGDFSQTTLSTNIQDLVSAAEHVRTEYGPPRLMIGHSLGGVATLAAAAHVPDCRAVCTIAAASHASHLKNHLPGQDTEDKGLDSFQVKIAGKQLQLRRTFLEDLDQHDIAQNIASLGRALLVLHAPADPIVEIAQAEQIFATARQPKSFVALEGADHLLSQREQAQHVACLIALWATPFLLSDATSPGPVSRCP